MKSEFILEMLKNNEIEELKRILEEEVYKNAMKNKGEKERYSAMKRFFRFANKKEREALKKPCKDIKYNGKLYNCFMDNYCLAITTESIGNMENYDNSNKDYYNVGRIISFNGDMEKLDLNKILAIAKSKGYKFKKSEIDANNANNALYYLKYKETYYKIVLLDKAFSVINDEKESEVYYSGKNKVLIIKTSIGIAGICPIILKGGIGSKIIIEN